MMHLLGSRDWNRRRKSIGAPTRRDNNISKKESKKVASFGTKNGPAYQDRVSDVKTVTEQVDGLMVLVIEWIDEQNTLEDVTDVEFHRWANGSGHNQLDLEWSLKQLYCFMNAKQVDRAKDIEEKATSEVHEFGSELKSTPLA